MMKSIISNAALLLAFSVLVSCSKEEQIGGPYMLYEIHGIVVDQAGNPLPSIEVSDGSADVVKTNVNGRFSFHGRNVPMTNARLIFEDKDGEANGGAFLKREVDIPIVLKLAGEKNGNFKGKYFAQDVEIILLPKNSEMQPEAGL